MMFEAIKRMAARVFGSPDDEEFAAPRPADIAEPSVALAKFEWQLCNNPFLHVEHDRQSRQLIITTIGDEYDPRARCVIPLQGDRAHVPFFSPAGEADGAFVEAVCSTPESRKQTWENEDPAVLGWLEAEENPYTSEGFLKPKQSADYKAMANIAMKMPVLTEEPRKIRKRLTIGYDAMTREHAVWCEKMMGRWPADHTHEPDLYPTHWTRNTTPAFRAAVDKVRRNTKDEEP